MNNCKTCLRPHADHTASTPAEIADVIARRADWRTVIAWYDLCFAPLGAGANHPGHSPEEPNLLVRAPARHRQHYLAHGQWYQGAPGPCAKCRTPHGALYHTETCVWARTPAEAKALFLAAGYQAPLDADPQIAGKPARLPIRLGEEPVAQRQARDAWLAPGGGADRLRAAQQVESELLAAHNAALSGRW